jgi:uncharacterized protein YabN with tetrapyrrole methylase and pyrophosphatase domain
MATAIILLQFAIVLALEKTNAKFIRRFNYIEEHSIRIGKPLKDMTLGEMDALWNEAKAQEKK